MYKPNEDAKKLLAATNVKKERRYGGETYIEYSNEDIRRGMSTNVP